MTPLRDIDFQARNLIEKHCGVRRNVATKITENLTLAERDAIRLASSDATTVAEKVASVCQAAEADRGFMGVHEDPAERV